MASDKSNRVRLATRINPVLLNKLKHEAVDKGCSVADIINAILQDRYKIDDES